MKRRYVIQGLAASLMVPLMASLHVQSTKAEGLTYSPKIFSDMQQGGYVIVFRHSATNCAQADIDPLHDNNIGKQRLLSDKGREQAKQIGESFKELGIPLGKIYTSKFLCAVETGKLISGRDVTATIDIAEGGLVASPIENFRRAASFRKMLKTIPDTGKNTLISTYQPNLIDVFGEDWFEVNEGEASVFKPDQSGKVRLVGIIQVVDWVFAAHKHERLFQHDRLLQDRTLLVPLR